MKIVARGGMDTQQTIVNVDEAKRTAKELIDAGEFGKASDLLDYCDRINSIPLAASQRQPEAIQSQPQA